MSYPVVNVRGGPGAGKSLLVRRLIYGLMFHMDAHKKLVSASNSAHPDYAIFKHPKLRVPLVILGTYQYVLGGCDKIDGLDKVYALLEQILQDRPDAGIIFEGGGSSRDTKRALAFAEKCKRFKILTLSTTPKECSAGVYERGTKLKQFYVRPPKDVSKDSYKSVIEADYQTCKRQVEKFEDAKVPIYYLDRHSALVQLVKWFNLTFDVQKISKLDTERIFKFVQECYDTNPTLL